MTKLVIKPKQMLQKQLFHQTETKSRVQQLRNECDALNSLQFSLNPIICICYESG